MTVDQIYEQTVRPLPAADRLRLATLIGAVRSSNGQGMRMVTTPMELLP
jgi:hypothetical protein